jgi:benzoate membrane transport protein
MRLTVTAVVAVVVGFASSIAIVFTGAERSGATPAQIGSWIGALCISMGLCTIVLSWRHRTPILLAWSVPGATLLAAAPERGRLSDTIGAFLLCGLLLFVTGVTGVFDRFIDRIPLPLASALLAGVLTRFALEAFGDVSEAEHRVMVIGMFITFVVARRFAPTFAAIIVLIVGVALAAVQGKISAHSVPFGLVDLQFVRPTLSVGALIGLGLPLYLVTMAAQNMPGTAALRSHGYDIPVSPALTASGLATMIGAGFGLFAINLAAVTAALIMGPDIHPDKHRRYPAAIATGALYVAVGLLGGSVAGVLTLFPKALVISVAAFALIPTITGGLAGALNDPGQREAAVIVFLVTVSGLTLAGIGAPFWALVAGLLVQLLRRVGQR